MKKNKKIAMYLGLAALGLTLCTAGTISYLTDYDSKVNEFTIGKVDIELDEPGWDPDQHTEIEPSEEITKDPQIKNTGQNSAYVFLEVSVPVKKVITAGEDGTRNEPANTELFSFTASNQWTLISSALVGTNQVYTYTYNSILKPDNTTVPLFKTVTFCNIIEGQLDTQAISMPIRAYGIQTVSTGGNGASVVDQAKAAYEKYVNQNLNQTGKVTQ